MVADSRGWISVSMDAVGLASTAVWIVVAAAASQEQGPPVVEA